MDLAQPPRVQRIVDGADGYPRLEELPSDHHTPLTGGQSRDQVEGWAEFALTIREKSAHPLSLAEGLWHNSTRWCQNCSHTSYNP